MDREQVRQEKQHIITNFIWKVLGIWLVLNLTWIIINSVHIVLIGNAFMDPWFANSLSVFISIFAAFIKVSWLPSAKKEDYEITHKYSDRQKEVCEKSQA